MYQGLEGDKTHQGNPHATEFRLQGMGDGVGDPTHVRVHHCLEERGGVGG